MTKNQIISNTLRWCNAQRKKQGKKPLLKLPKGHRGKPESCPCGKATGLCVGYSLAYDNKTGKSIRMLPESVRRFVLMFDGGQIPELEE
jgi:hypothetical protein